MTDYTPDDIPALPVAAIREALGRADLDAVQALLDAHDQAVRQSLIEPELLDPRQRQRWLDLLRQQQDLTAELGVLRDQVGAQLRLLQQHQRGTDAYLQTME